jgi:predicted DNA-binding transcriptional regulator AlpA
MPTALSAFPPSRRLIDADTVAAKLSWSRRQTFRAADSGLMPPGLRLGRLRRWDEAELDLWIAEGCRPVRKGAR